MIFPLPWAARSEVFGEDLNAFRSQNVVIILALMAFFLT